ncbi:MAG: MGMT family protein [Acutalibacteraceae bacterium]|jgi:methylated-DNA-protein-cysteine methyltransferase-like protein
MKDKVYEYLLKIPKGKVTTYGRIAKALGNKNLARVVGNILHNNPDPDKYPCFKVVNSKGELAVNFGFGGIDEQKRRLEKDGIEVKDYKVDLNKYLFD